MYYCEFCSYTSHDRDRIHYHHILPKSMGGSDKVHNRIYCCPNCHAKMFVGGSLGTHGIKGVEPIEIISILLSTGGRVVEYTTKGEPTLTLLKNTYTGLNTYS